MTIETCIDASIIAKLALAEEDSALAASFVANRDLEGAIVVPLHVYAETTSAVYKRVRAGEFTAEEGVSAITGIANLTLSPTHPSGVAQRALTIAAQLNLKYPYDAFYLALGELLDCEVWTADRALHAAAGAEYPRLRLLAEFETAT